MEEESIKRVFAVRFKTRIFVKIEEGKCVDHLIKKFHILTFLVFILSRGFQGPCSGYYKQRGENETQSKP